MKQIYLDYAATTPLDPAVADKMHKFEESFFGNPNSAHLEGQKARAQIDIARQKIGKFIGAKSQEIIFTSGATEANNHAIAGVIEYILRKKNFKPHVITTQLEHHSVFNVVKDLQESNKIEATFIKPSKDGLITSSQIITKIKQNTVLVSIIFVSNEIGTIFPVREIGKLLAQINNNRRNKIIFHIDAAQALKYYNCNVGKIGCDLMTVSAHKIYGPKGIGALFIKSGTKIENLLRGGVQEYGHRAGTQNTSGIIGFAEAIKQLGSLEKREEELERLKKIRDLLINYYSQHPKIRLNGPTGDYRSCDNINFTIIGIDPEEFFTKLDLMGIRASTGAACVSGSYQPSHVIKALGLIINKPSATVRLSMGKFTTNKEINSLIIIFNKIINEE